VISGIAGEKLGGFAGGWVYEHRNQIGGLLQEGSQLDQQGAAMVGAETGR
jgi:hypothetical protein